MLGPHGTLTAGLRAFRSGQGVARGCGPVAQLGGSFGPGRSGPGGNGSGRGPERDLKANAVQTWAPPVGPVGPAGRRTFPSIVDASGLELFEKRKELEEQFYRQAAEPEHDHVAASAAATADVAPTEAQQRAHQGASTSQAPGSSSDQVLFGTTRQHGEQRRRPTARTAAAPSAAARRRLAAWRTAAAGPASTAASRGQQLSEAQRDAVYLANLREQLQRGRRRRAGAQPDSVSMFLVSLGNTAVLTRAQEVELCAILQRGMRLERAAVAQQHQLGRLPTLDDVATAGGLASGAEVAQVARNRAEAEDLMVQHNMRLVFSVCKRYLNRGVELSDLLMDGVAGMRRALLRFDPAKGFKFSTYCHWWIRQAVTRSINEQSRTVRLPQHTTESLSKVMRAAELLSMQQEEPATHTELARAVGMSPVRLIALLRLAGPNDNLPSTSGLLKEMPMEDFLGVEAGEGDQEGAEFDKSVVESLRFAFDLVIGTLPKRERNIMRLHMGLVPLESARPGTFGASATAVGGGPSSGGGGGGGSAEMPDGVMYAPPLTLADLAEVHGLGKERIRQLHDKALLALRRPWRQQLLRHLLGLPQELLPVECCGEDARQPNAMELPY